MLEGPAAAPQDGRQSETALAVARGTRRLLRGLGFASLTELPLATGHRADVVAIKPNGEILIVEIKSSIADFRADLKWPHYRQSCDRLYFAIPAHVPTDIMPTDAGLIIADAFGADILRDAPTHKLAPATRRAMLLRFAQTAADRLLMLVDPGSGTAGL